MVLALILFVSFNSVIPDCIPPTSVFPNFPYASYHDEKYAMTGVNSSAALFFSWPQIHLGSSFSNRFKLPKIHITIAKSLYFHRQVELEALSEFNQIEVQAVTEEQYPDQGLF